MKPRLTLLSAWYDCGWRYETWQCVGDGVIGKGRSPASAYGDWKRWVGR